MDEYLESLRNKTFNPDLKDLIEDISKDPDERIEETDIEDSEGSFNKIPFFYSKLDYSINEKLDGLIQEYLENISELRLKSLIQEFNSLKNRSPARIGPNEMNHLYEMFNPEHQKSFLMDQDARLYELLVEFWSWMPHNMDLFIRNIYTIFYSCGRFLNSCAEAFHIYSQRDTVYFPLFYNGIDQDEVINYLFTPDEPLMISFRKIHQPRFFHWRSENPDFFLQKKLPQQYLDSNYSLLTLPIFGMYRNLKPKNLLLISYFFKDLSSLTMLKEKYMLVYDLIENFFPMVDFLRLIEKDYHEGSDIVERVHNYMKDRRAYPSEEGKDEFLHNFIVIRFQMKNHVVNEHSVQFQYLIAKLQRELSFKSKIIQYSYDKGYIILTGSDMSRKEKLQSIFRDFPEKVTWKVKNYPDLGRNLYNYQ